MRRGPCHVIGDRSPKRHSDASDTEYILGLANMDEGVKILLDIDRVMTAADVALLEQAA
jgi:chemotaxis signal transduction protein